MFSNFNTDGAWQAKDLIKDKRWVFALNVKARQQLAQAAQKAFDPDRSLFDYRKDDFDLGPGIFTIKAAAQEAYFGCGLSLVKGLPKEELDEKVFRLMIWAIGLNLGVARPQGIASQYISEVCAAGANYRAPNGRGYSSNEGLDFHCDGCDLVALACYNKAKNGGQSMVSSSATAWKILTEERPDLALVAQKDFYFSRNQEQSSDESPYYVQPLFDFEEGRLFAKWNRNRVRTCQDIIGVPPLTDSQKECANLLDKILSRKQLMFTMWLEPGDLQFLNNHIMLHSRTAFEDYPEPERRRLLFRLWLAPPNSFRLPKTWEQYFRSIAPGTVRGGIRGQKYSEACMQFEKSQAKSMGMPIP